MPKFKTTPEIDEKICKYYENGETSTKIAKIFNLSYQTVLSILKRNNKVIRKFSETSRRYRYDINYFEKIDTSDKAYWLGFIYADGSISQFKNSLQIILAEIDKEVLEDFRTDLNCNKNLYYKKSKKPNKQGAYAIELNSEKLSKDLIDKGVFPNKSAIIRIPFKKIEKNLIPHFLRGYFDGDGSIGVYRKLLKVTITSNWDFLKDISQYLLEAGINNGLYKYKNKNATNLSINSKYAEKFCELIYKDAGRFMKRKFKIFKDYKKEKYSYKYCNKEEVEGFVNTIKQLK